MGQTVAVQEGTRATVELPRGAQVLTARAASGGETLWSLAVGEDEPHDEIAALALAGKQGDERAVARLEALAIKSAPPERGLAQAALGRVALAHNQVEKALPALRLAVEAARSDGRLSDVVKDETVLMWGLTELRQRFAEARMELATLREAASRYPEGEACAAYAEGGLASLGGDLRTALNSYRISVRLAERLGLDRLRNQAAEDLGRVYTALGRADDAVATLTALPLAGDACARATSAINRAEAYLAQRAEMASSPEGIPDDSPAQATLALARREAQTCGELHRRVLATIYALDDALARGHRAEAAEAAAELGALDQHADALASLWRHDALGRWALAEGRASQALTSFEEEAALARSAGVDESAVRAEVGAGRSLLALGRHRPAVTRLREAAQMLRGALARVPVAEGRGDFLRGHDEAFRYLVEALVSESRPLEALDVAQAARRAELASLARTQRLAQLPPSERARWDQAIERYAQLRHGLESESADDWTLSRADLARARAARQARAEQARQALDEAYRVLDGREPASATGRAVLAAGEVEVTFFPGPRESNRWYVFARDGRGTQVIRTPATALTSNATAPAILEALEAALGRARRVRLLTYDRADRIDWQSVAWRGAALAEALQVTYALDLRAEVVHPSATEAAILLVSDPSGDLPDARREGESLAARWAQVPLMRLEGRAATRDAVLAALSRAALFHYAGHAETLGPGGMSSALLMADGARIELGDLLAAPRVPAAVVLSACEAGASAPRSLMGIAQAFLMAGSEAVVAAPRAVGDTSARHFMTSLHGHLARADVEALAEAYGRAWREANQSDSQMFRLVVQ